MPEPKKIIYYCTHCGHEVETPLPVEPVYSLKMAAMLIPVVTTRNLSSMLLRYKNELSKAQYRQDNRGVRHRMLTASDIRLLRSKVVKPGYTRKERGLPPRLPPEEYHKLKEEYKINRIKLDNGMWENFNTYWKRTRPETNPENDTH